MIAYNRPPFFEKSIDYIREACEAGKTCGDGHFTKKVSELLLRHTGTGAALLTTSCSHALDMMALLIGIEPGDEVIMPSFNFVSAGNAVALRGGVPVFVDVRPDTMNIDENKIEDAITDSTRAILALHYAGVACEMDAINAIAKKHGLIVLEDAAQCLMASYKGKPLGSMGTFGAYSFHETKNYSMGEGGCLLVNDAGYIERAEILREKGTDRSRFFRGQVDKYSWQDVGSSYLPSDLNAAFLLPQLERMEEINSYRRKVWNIYREQLAPLCEAGKIELQHIPPECVHNGHIFYIKCKDMAERTAYIEHMRQRGVMCVFHYVPLHTAPAGQRFGRFNGEDEYTARESGRLVRLPLYYGISGVDVDTVCASTREFFGG